ncbi:hypothetical protein G7Z17_g5956 [Cylindrodendrum hubeiense]|uniref:DASH complex subunit DAM1 n=1 Tax=Cylindrodendrum hubeiense TaxID=595255 RepID=A0A9P5HG44_9HYPO|nr:hypothetical protein G7Z17_g5956 [Cylindrodendrum hubeiense]
MSGEHHRSNSRSRTSRPTTPLRPSSRSSFRDSARSAGDGDAPFPLNAFEPAFAELSDAMADLEVNMMHFQVMHESLARFSESFASFLYGLNMNAFCVDFPEGPVPESFRRERPREEQSSLANTPSRGEDGDMTFIYLLHREPPHNHQGVKICYPGTPPVATPGGSRNFVKGQRQHSWWSESG